jgi:hypothetical protein
VHKFSGNIEHASLAGHRSRHHGRPCRFETSRRSGRTSVRQCFSYNTDQRFTRTASKPGIGSAHQPTKPTPGDSEESRKASHYRLDARPSPSEDDRRTLPLEVARVAGPMNKNDESNATKPASQPLCQFEHVPLTPLEKQGVRRVLRLIERDRLEAAEANRNANFDRQRGITSGMSKAYQRAYAAILAEFPEVLSGNSEFDSSEEEPMQIEPSKADEEPLKPPQQRSLPFS